MDPNEEGTIYYGTRFENTQVLDRAGIKKPIERKGERYISVSVSGYSAIVGIDVHDEITAIAMSLVGDGHAIITDGHLVYHRGYQHSLTAYHGFGPSRSTARNVLSSDDLTERNQSNATAVIPARYRELLCGHTITENVDFFAYCSLALHEFLPRIDSDMIRGWIVSRDNAETIVRRMDDGLLSRREVWCVDEL